MSRHFRQAKILELIENSPIETQEDIGRELRNAGFNTTQATISRDIKDLGLIKAPYGERSRYVRDTDKSVMLKKIKEIFRVSTVRYEQVGNIIVLNTLGGMANSASIMIKQLGVEGLVGCIAGHDTVFVLVRTAEIGARLVESIEEILSN